MAVGSGAALIPGMLVGCNREQLAALEGWNGHSKAEKDIRIIVLSYAILAPNPHNKQPWIIHLRDQHNFDLYVDPERLLPETDPPYRQIHIGQGTFLENLSLAAKHFGYCADITYFPDGMYGNTVLENRPVASIKLATNSEIQKDPLFDQILTRQSNKRVYENIDLSKSQIDGLKAVVGSAEGDCYLNITSNPDQRTKLSEIATKAMAIESSERQRDEETIAMFRFNDEETEQFRDGFGVAQSGTTGLVKFLAETFFLSRKSAEADSAAFGKEAISLTQKQAESAAAYGWLVTRHNTRLAQVKTGRVYNRLNLTATALGVAMHPMSQVLQEYPDMDGLQKEFKKFLNIPDSHTVQMLFRLGIADPVTHSPRRRVRGFLQV